MGLATIETTPPRSRNQDKGAHWAAVNRRKRQSQGELALLLLAAEVPRPIPGGRVRATAELLFPTDRRRDEGNFRDSLEKALGDALAPHDPDAPFRWLPDDTPDHFTFGAVTFGLTPVLEAGPRAGKRRPAIARITLAWGDDLAQLLEQEARQLRQEVKPAA